MLSGLIAKPPLVRPRLHVMSYYPSIMCDQSAADGNGSTNNNVAILRKLKDNEKFTLSFRLKSERLGGINKQFNMCRNLNENTSEFITRLAFNIERVYSKKLKNKKVKVDIPSSEELDVIFYRNGIPIEDQSLKIQDILFEPNAEFSVIGEKFTIDIDPPLVEGAKLPNTLMSGFMVYPVKFKLESAHKFDSHYEWFVSRELFNNQEKDADNKNTEAMTTKELKASKEVNVQHLSWIKKAEGFYFVPSNEDINRYIKFVCHPKCGDRPGIDFEMVSKTTVSAGPGDCPFIKRHAFTTEVCKGTRFRILSYNLLADLYADSEFSRTVLFSQCPPYALDIEYRKQLILKELLGYNADIICLQEVDNKVFDGDLLPVLSEKDSFDGVFNRKGGEVSEGLACFWRTTKFRKLHTARIILSDTLQSEPRFEAMWKVVQSNENLNDSMLARTTAIQINVLESLTKAGHGLIIGITHLYFKPEADHIRLLQTALCLGHLEKTLKLMKESNPKMQFSVILAGDFNSTPPFGVLQFLREGTINDAHPDWLSCKEEQVVGLSIKHPFSMDSACGTPKYTNYTTGFKDCLDYIFYETDHLQVEAVVPFPLEEELAELEAIPNIVFPSDHLASVAELKWIK